MAKDVDAVIAALKAALQDAQARNFYSCESRVANRWINKLPGAWTGKWRHLKVQSDILGEILREDFIGQVRATIAYLETNKDAIVGTSLQSFSGLFRRRKPIASEPLDADFSEVPLRTEKRKAAPALVKLVKKD
ncbi:MAG: hypothetical protein WCD20_12725 [Rhodomicrobium sp.]